MKIRIKIDESKESLLFFFFSFLSPMVAVSATLEDLEAFLLFLVSSVDGFSSVSFLTLNLLLLSSSQIAASDSSKPYVR